MASLTSFERDCVYSALVAQDDRHCLPYGECGLRSLIFPNRPFVGLKQIAAAREKLVARGVWIRKQSPRKEWLEIHPDYRHTEGRNETSYGDDQPAPSQGELGFAPVVVPVVTARAVHKINGSRAEEKRREEERTPTPASEASVVAGHEVPTLDQALSMGSNQMIPEAFTRAVFGAWESRDGKDAAGVRVHLGPYLKRRWEREKTEWTAGTHREQQKGNNNHATATHSPRHRGRNVPDEMRATASEYAAG